MKEPREESQAVELLANAAKLEGRVQLRAATGELVAVVANQEDALLHAAAHGVGGGVVLRGRFEGGQRFVEASVRGPLALR